MYRTTRCICTAFAKNAKPKWKKTKKIDSTLFLKLCVEQPL